MILYRKLSLLIPLGVIFYFILQFSGSDQIFVGRVGAEEFQDSRHQELTKLDAAFRLRTIEEKAEQFSLFFDRLPIDPEPVVATDTKQCKATLSSVREKIGELIVQPAAVYQTYEELEENLPLENCGPVALDRHWLSAPPSRLGEYLQGSQEVKDRYNVTAYIADRNFAFYQMSNTGHDDKDTQEGNPKDFLVYAENYCRRSSERLDCPIPSSKYTQFSPTQCRRLRVYAGSMRYEPSRDETLAGLRCITALGKWILCHSYFYNKHSATARKRIRICSF